MDLVELKVLLVIGLEKISGDVSNGPGGVERNGVFLSLKMKISIVSNGPGGVERIIF